MKFVYNILSCNPNCLTLINPAYFFILTTFQSNIIPTEPDVDVYASTAVWSPLSSQGVIVVHFEIGFE